MPLRTLTASAVIPSKQACCAASAHQANGGHHEAIGSHGGAAITPQATSTVPSEAPSPRSVEFRTPDAAAIAQNSRASHSPQKPGGAEWAAADELVQVCGPCLVLAVPLPGC